MLLRSTTWIWARSPSYFHSPVKRLPVKRSVTSPRPFEGFASIGFTGMPSEMWHASARFSAVRPSMSAPTSRSKFGISLKAWRTAASIATICPSRAASDKRPAPLRVSGTSAVSARAGVVSTKAYARDCKIVGIWIPMRSLACSIRTMYLASSPRVAASIFWIFSFLAFCESLPEAWARPFISVKTFSIISFGGAISIFCAILLSIATSPRSFASPVAMAALICFSERPNVSHMARMTVLSPTPSSASS
mmetsp:Transcript_65258/g.183721  ORF Transcript_65258/g.183721 Transcript_65258/m.183721 type:complete len:249 (-) Transcript_65258:545-1291(-)